MWDAGERHAIAQTQGKMNEVIVFMQIYSKDNQEYIDFNDNLVNTGIITRELKGHLVQYIAMTII